MDRRLTTIMATDLVGYSRLMAADEESVIARLRTARADLIDPAISTADGRIVKTMGDGLLIEFPSPVAAVRMALQVQRAMVKREAGPSDDRLRFRIGVNLGDVVEDGDDILGDGVNVAARLESLAPPGGICISRAVRDQLRGKIDAPMTGLGPQSVKNMPEPIDVWRVEVEGVKARAPRKETDRPSIAILPFDNLSRDPDQDYLADGVVEDVITELSRFRSLFVIARNSTFAYKGTHKDIRQIASELGVRYVVEGSVRRAGDRLRLTAQLIEAATGNHIWADRFDRMMDDIFDLQDELTQTLVTRIEPELGAHERTLARRKPPDSLNAWELYQRAQTEMLAANDAEALPRGGELCRQAIAADPSFAPAYSLFSRMAWMRIALGRSEDREADVRQAVEYGRRALELDDRLEMAHCAIGQALALAGRPEDGRRALNRAQALNPNSAYVQLACALGELFRESPDTERIERCALTSLRLDPNGSGNWGNHTMIGLARFWRDFDWTNPEVREPMEAAAASANVDWFPPIYAALANASIGRDDVAARYVQQALAIRPDITVAAWRRAFDFPMWARNVAASEPYLPKLIEMGLPAE